MRRHLWMHLALLGAIGALFGLTVLGVAVPIWVAYLVVLACPLMMVLMMAHHHDNAPRGDEVHGHDHHSISGITH